MRRWFWEIHHEEQQTCCHLVPKQRRWCPLKDEKKAELRTSTWESTNGMRLISFLTFHLHHIHRYLLLSHSEDLKVGNDTLNHKKEHFEQSFTFNGYEAKHMGQLLYLHSFGCPVDFNAEIVSISLPVELAVHNVKQVTNSRLISWWQLHKSYSCWDIFILRNPECNDTIRRWPGEIPKNKIIWIIFLA